MRPEDFMRIGPKYSTSEFESGFSLTANWLEDILDIKDSRGLAVLRLQ